LIADFNIRGADYHGLGDMFIQYFMDEIYRSGFPIRPRYTDDEKILGRVAIHVVCYLSHKPFPQLIDDAILEQKIEFIVEGYFFDE